MQKIAIEHRKAAIGSHVTNGSYDLEVEEKYIIMLALAGVNQKDKFPENKWMKVELSDFKKVMAAKKEEGGDFIEARTDVAKLSLTRSLNRLFEETLTFYNPENNNTLESHRWIISKRVNSDDSIEIIFNPVLLPYLSELKTYSNVVIKEIVGIKCKYALRLLELLAQDRSNGRTNGLVVINLEEFHFFIRAKECYKEYKYLKKYVLLPAIEELKRLGVVDIELKEIKGGKSVVSLEFAYWFKRKITEGRKKVGTGKQEKQ